MRLYLTRNLLAPPWIQWGWMVTDDDGEYIVGSYGYACAANAVVAALKTEWGRSLLAEYRSELADDDARAVVDGALEGDETAMEIIAANWGVSAPGGRWEEVVG